MNFDFWDEIKNSKYDNVFFSQVVDTLESLLEKVNAKLEEKIILTNEKKKEGELYYVYAYTPEKVYITKQKSNKVELLEGVSDEFKRSLAEGFILRLRDGNFFVDEELTEKSMNFELDFDNYTE